MNDFLQSVIDRAPAAKSKLSVVLTYPGVFYFIKSHIFFVWLNLI